jgi:alpha,alpha-trehalose phosphorylase
MIKINNNGLVLNPWSVSAPQHNPDSQLLYESLFAQANGYIGSRGTYEELAKEDGASCEGVYLNGVYQQEPIEYGESAYGFATHNQKMLQVPNGKRIEMMLDGIPLTYRDSNPVRQFDFKRGVYNRQQKWTTSSGKTLTLNSTRFVSLANQHLMCIRYELVSNNFSGALDLTSYLDANYSFQVDSKDPRVGRLSIAEGLNCISHEQEGQTNVFLHAVEGSDFKVASFSMDEFSDEAECVRNINDPSLMGHHYRITLTQDKPLVFYKWIGYDHADELTSYDLTHQLERTIREAAAKGFEHQLGLHTQCIEQFWNEADVELEGNDSLQCGIRFNMYHIYQSSGRNGRCNIGAKGLTGHGYDGHYFWDTEVYVIPFLCYTQPELARSLLQFRINTLDKAKARARTMSHAVGALYPWRTIGGEECSAYFPAGTAQYHINSDIAYALKTYIQATNDIELLWQGGAEVLFETARLWMDLGYFNVKRQGQFCIDGVTGPDEYTAIVNNNAYTNMMAKAHLQYAFDTAKRLESLDGQRFEALMKNIGLVDDEFLAFYKAANLMYIPYDETIGVHGQDDTFLTKKKWDFDSTPSDKYPLLLNFHPLVIYRHQVLKQADTVLAMYLLDDQFTTEQKQRNLNYYEPLTTHDSSLSSCIHALAYAEVGDIERSHQFFKDTALMDLENHHNNSQFGVHIACMGGSWASIVHGFAGLRVRGNGLSFKPKLPDSWKGYRFRFRYREACLQVAITKHNTTYELVHGKQLTLFQNSLQFTLNELNPSRSIAHLQEETIA